MSNPNLRVKHIKYRIKFKEEVVKHAKEHSVNETAEQFEKYRKKTFKSGKKLLECSSKKHATTFHLAGAGRKLKQDTVERCVIDFFRDCCA